MLKHFIIFAFAIFSTLTISGQEEQKFFSQDELIWLLKNYHPISLQSDLLIQSGNEGIKQSRGSLDPYIYANVDQKYYSSKNYYSMIGSSLKIPTWLGIDFKGGYDLNNGVYLNPQNNTPEDGLWFAGVSVPLGQGLFIDKRRAEIKKAELLANSNIEEQKIILNQLYIDAIKQYWKWVASYYKYKVYEESISLAQERFEAVRASYFLGDEPAIDTLEAMIQLQQRQISLNEYELKFKNESLELSNYLWFENNTPLELNDSTIPPDIYLQEAEQKLITPDTLNSLLSGIEYHPELIKYNYKIESLDISRKLKAEYLKPKVNVNYNFLNYPDSPILNNFSFDNYKWGVEVGMPLFLRKERGELQLAKLKLQDAQYEVGQKGLEISNKIKKAHNKQINLNQQVELYNNAVKNYQSMLDGENAKFEAGESSLFLINSRETKLLDAKIKLIDLTAELRKSNFELLYYAGILYKL